MEINATIFLQIFIFVSLLLWLSRSLFTPILRLFDERERRIEGAREEAVRLNLLAEERSKTFSSEYEKAKDDARILLSQMKYAMEKEHTESLEKTKAHARELIMKADLSLKEQEASIKGQLKSASVSIADDIVSVVARPYA